MDLVPCEGGEHLLKFLDYPLLVVFEVFEDEGLVGFTIQAPGTGVSAAFIGEIVEFLGKQIPGSAASTHEFNNSPLGEVREAAFEIFRHAVSLPEVVEDEEVLNVEGFAGRGAHFFEELQESRVLDMLGSCCWRRGVRRGECLFNF